MAYDFGPYEAVLLDLDGTVYRDEHLLPGAVGLLGRLEREGKKYACLSNTTLSPAQVVAHLRAMGIAVAAEHVYTAAAAACDYVRERWPGPAPGSGSGAGGRRPRVFNLATRGVHELLDGGVDWVAGEGEACDAVIVGTPKSAYAEGDRPRVAVALLRAGAALVGTSADRVYPSPRGMEFGSGAFTTMLAYAANVEPVFTGKPQPLFFRKLCECVAVDPARCVIIGDNLESDIRGGNGVGMHTILTLTGVTRRADLVALGDATPDHVVEGLAEL